MRTPLAWRNILQKKGRTFAAVAGVAFPVLLVFVQLGLRDSVLRGSTLIYDALDFDVILVSSQYVSIAKAGGVSRTRLLQSLSVPGIEAAIPFYVGVQYWRHLETGSRRNLLVFACDPRRCPFRVPEILAQASALQRLDHLLIDRLTRPEYGPHPAGAVAELGGRRVHIAGEYTLGAGFIVDGTVVVSDDTYARLFRNQLIDEVSVGLLRVASAADPERVAAELNARLPGDARAWTRRELTEHEREFWRTSTSIGTIFGMGVVVGFAVLIVIVYQLLSMDITARLREYATLKALGYGHGSLSWVVLQQALMVVGAASFAGLALSTAVYAVVGHATRLPVVMTTERAIGVVVLTLALSLTAAVVALRRLRAADPAELF